MDNNSRYLAGETGGLTLVETTVMKKHLFFLTITLITLSFESYSETAGESSEAKGIRPVGMCPHGFAMGGWITGQTEEQEEWCEEKILQGFKSALDHPIGRKVPLLGPKLPGESEIETDIFDADNDKNISCNDLVVYRQYVKTHYDRGEGKRDGSGYRVKECE